MKTTLDRKIYFINIIFLLTFSLLIFYLLYSSLSEQKDSLIKDAERKTASISKFMSTDIDRFILSVGEIIEGIHNVDELIEEHSDDLEEHNHEVDTLLKKSLRPYIMNILVIDENLNATHWASQKNKESIENIKYIYTHFQKTNSKDTLLSTPTISKTQEHTWFFNISKGYYVNDHLHSVIIVFFDAGFFKSRYKDNILSSFFILSPSGKIYLHDPSKNQARNAHIQRIKNFTQTGLEKKHYYIREAGVEDRISTYVSSKNNPIVVGVDLLAKDILAPWEKNKKHVYIIAAILSLGFLILIFFYTKMQNQLVRLTRYDSLSQLFNRGYFTQRALHEYARALRYNDELSILMIDIDKFKKINDTFGHKQGDIIIQSISKDIISNIRELDFAGRYGGEEFIVLLPKAGVEEALLVANRIKDSIELNHKNSKIPVTASFGIATLKDDDENLDQVIIRADNALYLSKEKGRNCINII